jgi:hypothetical protein
MSSGVPPSRRVPSPLATGGAGTVFEQHVAAYWLAHLLVRATPPVLNDCTVVGVQFQVAYRDWRTDDLVVEGIDERRRRRRLLCQIKRTLTVSSSDSDFSGAITSAWVDFRNTERFSPDLDCIAIITLRGSNALLEHFAGLLQMSRDAQDPADFQTRLTRYGHGKTGDYLTQVQKVLWDVDRRDVLDSDVWAFLRVLHVLSLDLTTSTGQAEAHVKSLLAMSASGDDAKAAADATWDALVRHVGESIPRAHRYERDTLPWALRHRHATPAVRGSQVAIENYRRHSQREWAAAWSNASAREDSGAAPPFIADQGIRILTRNRIGSRYTDPRPYLRPEYFRTLRPVQEQGRLASSNVPWQPVPRSELLERLSQSDVSGRWSRCILVTDAGIGKTTNMRWLHAHLNAVGGAVIAIHLDVATLPVEPSAVIRTLTHHLRRANGNDEAVGSDQEVDSVLIGMRREGRLVLLIDALDQVDAANLACLQTLRHLLVDEHWKSCPIVLGSRPFAVERDWNLLFPDAAATGWQFLHVEEFNPDQQRRYLGTDRYDLVPVDAHPVLSIPRVLHYLFFADESDFQAIRTASDVYTLATSKLLEDGLRARGAEDLLPLQARLVLSAIAFEMALGAKNFHAVQREGMDDFLRRVAERCHAYDPAYGLDWTIGKLRQIVSMNEFLRHALLEAGCPQHLQWRNRSLQEFFAGLWLSKYATEADAEAAGQKKFLAGRPATEDFREVWRFAAEMPAAMRTPLSWVRVMATLFTLPGRRAFAERSTEMIYRSWNTMHAYAAATEVDGPQDATTASARAAIGQFATEFPNFLSGRHGGRAQLVARQLFDSFVRVPPAGCSLSFRMGSPTEEPGRSFDERLHDAVVEQPFAITRYQVTVEQYELFDSKHMGKRDRYRWKRRFPAVYISWYDAWVFCRWLGAEYRLPTETEWEYACRAGSQGAYCFGDDRKVLKWYARCGGFFATRLRPLPVGCLRPNAWGLFDMHGNCWEWCETWYHKDTAMGAASTYVGSSRVVRGGSCFDATWRARSAARSYRDPRHMDARVGFRVVKDSHKDP